MLTAITIGIASILLTIDVVKIFLETLYPKNQRKLYSDPTQFTVIITAYNESKIIARTIRCFSKIFPKENIILADDGSTDGTAEVARSADPEIRVISFPHQGKNKTTEAALKYVGTDYVILSDADVYPQKDLRCPRILMESATSCAVKVLPKLDFDNGLSSRNILLGLQNHEYEKAMNSKLFGSNWESVHSVSGAFGFFTTKRLKYLMPQQTEVFAGEDLERTLIDLVNNGKTEYLDQLVETDVPQTAAKLVQQRVFSWWPGLWRCFPLFVRLLFKKQASIALRFEVFYQLLSTATEPLKLYSLILLFVHKQWEMLLGLYFLYFFLELFVGLRLNELNRIKHFFLTIALCPLYGLAQLVLRIVGLEVFLFKRILRRWPGIKPQLSNIGLRRITYIFLLLFGATGVNAGELKISPGVEYTQDSNSRILVSPTFSANYKKTWLDSQYGEYNNRLDFGASRKWLGIDWTPQLRTRTRESFELTPKLVVEAPLIEPIVGRLGVGYQLLGDLQGTTLHSAGLDIYYSDANFVSLDTTKIIGNHKKSDVFLLKNRLTLKNFTLNVGGSVNTFGDTGFFSWVSWKWLRFSYGWNKNFEHHNFNRTQYNLSLHIPLK